MCMNTIFEKNNFRLSLHKFIRCKCIFTLNIRRSFRNRFDANALTTCCKIKRPRCCCNESIDPTTSFNRGISCKYIHFSISFHLNKTQLNLCSPQPNLEDNQSVICFQLIQPFVLLFVALVLETIHSILIVLFPFFRQHLLHCNIKICKLNIIC